MSDKTRWLIQKSEVVSDEAVVATMHPLASEAGAEVLRKGGNAADAAVAAAFAVGVVEPHMSGLGGICQLVYWDAATGRSSVIDGTSTLPRAISPDLYELEPGTTGGLYGWPGVVGDANTTSWRAAAVPGMPAAMGEALRRLGRLSLRDVLEPAIGYAENGFPVDWSFVLYLARDQSRLAALPEARRVFYQPDGSCHAATSFDEPPDVLRQPDLARTLRLIAEEGPETVYTGEVARLMAEDMAENGGLITAEDLAEYRVRVFEPGLVGEYRGHQTIQAPGATGGPTTLEMLNILEGYDLARLGHNSAEALHLIAEAQRRAFADRFAHMGDDASWEWLTTKEHAAKRRADLDPARATPEAAASPSPDAVHTTHLTVIDRDGNMAALTSTLGTSFGCGVVPRGTGIVLNAGVTWFDPRPGRLNSIGPGKRILWAGTPTLVLREGRPLLGVGAPGGRKILTAVLQSILNVVDFGMGPQAAVSAPRVHCEGPVTMVDARVGTEAIEGLRRLGHRLNVVEETFGSSFFARPNMVLVDPATGQRRGGVNVFSSAAAVGL